MLSAGPYFLLSALAAIGVGFFRLWRSERDPDGLHRRDRERQAARRALSYPRSLR